MAGSRAVGRPPSLPSRRHGLPAELAKLVMVALATIFVLILAAWALGGVVTSSQVATCGILLSAIILVYLYSQRRGRRSEV